MSIRLISAVVAVLLLGTPTFAQATSTGSGTCGEKGGPSCGPSSAQGAPGNGSPAAGTSAAAEKRSEPKDHGGSLIDRVHSEGGGWGSMKTRSGVEPSGFYKDGTVGVGVTVHFGSGAKPKCEAQPPKRDANGKPKFQWR